MLREVGTRRAVPSPPDPPDGDGGEAIKRTEIVKRDMYCLMEELEQRSSREPGGTSLLVLLECVATLGQPPEMVRKGVKGGSVPGEWKIVESLSRRCQESESGDGKFFHGSPAV